MSENSRKLTLWPSFWDMSAHEHGLNLFRHFLGIWSRNTFSRLSPPQRPPTVAPWEKYTRGARRLGRGKIKARRERLFPLPIVPRAPVFSLQRSRSRFFLWCLQTGASAEERVFSSWYVRNITSVWKACTLAGLANFHLCVLRASWANWGFTDWENSQGNSLH